MWFYFSQCGNIIGPKPVPPGTVPAAHNESIHAVRCMAQLRSKDKAIEKFIYLSQLKHTDENMFYRLCLMNMAVSDHCLSSLILPTLGKRGKWELTIPCGAGIHADHLYTDCRGCLPATFTHFPSTRRTCAYHLNQYTQPSCAAKTHTSMVIYSTSLSKTKEKLVPSFVTGLARRMLVSLSLLTVRLPPALHDYTTVH